MVKTLVTIGSVEKRLGKWLGCYYLDPEVDVEQWAAENGFTVVYQQDCGYDKDPGEVIARDASLVLGSKERLSAKWEQYLEQSMKEVDYE